MRAEWRLVAMVTAVLATAAYLLSGLLPRQYVATARVFLDSSWVDAAAGAGDSARVVSTQADLAVSNASLRTIARRDGLTAEEVNSRLHVEPSPSGNFFTMTATAESPRVAVDLLRNAEDVYATTMRQAANQALKASLNEIAQTRTEVQGQIAGLQSELNATEDFAQRQLQQARVAALEDQLGQLNRREATQRADAATAPSPIQLADPPSVPAPTSPTPLRNAAIAGLLGLFMGGLMGWWRRNRGRHREPSAMLSETLGLRLLASIQAGGSGWTSRVRRREHDATGGYGQAALATILAAPATEVLALTGARPQDLRPELALGLAGAFADIGYRVLLVDGDVFGHELTRAVDGTPHDPQNRAHEPQALSAREQVSATGSPFRVVRLPVGALQGRPDLIHLRESTANGGGPVDLVVLVTPPLTTVPALLTSQADGVVLVVHRSASRAEIADLANTLPGLQANVLGCIVDEGGPEKVGTASVARGTVVKSEHVPATSHWAANPEQLPAAAANLAVANDALSKRDATGPA